MRSLSCLIIAGVAAYIAGRTNNQPFEIFCIVVSGFAIIGAFVEFMVSG
jgi:hypothetical protein